MDFLHFGQGLAAVAAALPVPALSGAACGRTSNTNSTLPDRSAANFRPVENGLLFFPIKPGVVGSVPVDSKVSHCASVRRRPAISRHSLNPHWQDSVLASAVTAPLHLGHLALTAVGAGAPCVAGPPWNLRCPVNRRICRCRDLLFNELDYLRLELRARKRTSLD
jgi:hypothetical protein